MTLKESAIREYISNIDFKSDNWKLSDIKRDMRKFLGEEPGVDIIYKKDVLINEATMKAEEFIGIDKIEIVYYDTDERFKKLEFRVDI
jgi:threonine aldolase